MVSHLASCAPRYTWANANRCLETCCTRSQDRLAASFPFFFFYLFFFFFNTGKTVTELVLSSVNVKVKHFSLVRGGERKKEKDR